MSKLSRIFVNAVTIILLATAISCSESDKMKNNSHQFPRLENVTENGWKKLSERTFYFGHQSVGYNILEGVNDLKKKYPELRINIVESKRAEGVLPGTFLHSKVGKNTDPESKIAEFKELLGNGIADKANVVALKFCYLDIMSISDPEEIFKMYRSEIEQIREKYANLTIVHFTSPLTVLQTGPKAWIKKLIGKPVYGAIENKKRYEYNRLIRGAYQGRDPILDIAAIESTKPDGRRVEYGLDGKTYYSLYPDYSNDGGHLNELGRLKVAEELILLLLNLYD